VGGKSTILEDMTEVSEWLTEKVLAAAVFACPQAPTRNNNRDGTHSEKGNGQPRGTFN
jgi:hypothetical protein